MRFLSWKLLGTSSGIRSCRLQLAPLLSLSLKSLFHTASISSRARCVNLFYLLSYWQLAVDLWRLFTGETTAEKLGLVYLPDAA